MTEIDFSKMTFTPPTLEDYLVKNNLKLTFVLLMHGSTTSIGRYMLLKEKTERIKNSLLSPMFPKRNLLFDMAKLHCELLDLLANVFMFLEDFLAYSHNLKTSDSLEMFPNKIASENYHTAQREIENLRRMTQSSVDAYLLLPGVGKMPINDNEKRFVIEVLDRIRAYVCDRIQNIVRFYDNYYRVYIKYKHILPAIIGLHQIKANPRNAFEKNISSHIYIRDYYKKHFKSYVIPWNIDTLTYYEDLIIDIKSLFELLVMSYLHYFMNYGKHALLPIENYIKKDEYKKWREILVKTDAVRVLLPRSETQLNISGELSKALLNKLPIDHIYVLNRDIIGATV
jgi:hypothetical protein